ncbi:MAG: UDP-N-acetylmuramoylalanyl-D-glutamyl-2,6-diaminopimelate--D-alanyl-D-alanyl ligase [Pseudomonadota bacterium]|jgi:UDP-N-acetylmuramoyl-tripeptide--D-alanyl-D-alanine ligase
MMNLSTWAQFAQGTLIGEDCTVSTLCTDSRNLQAGDVFVALKGPNFDGHTYLAEVAARGAVAAVVEHINEALNLPQIVVADTVQALGRIASGWRAQQFQGVLFAITGSCGKTTVKGLLKSICEQAGSTLATVGNLNNHLGVPLTLMQLRPSHQFAVVEMGASGPGEIAYLTQLAQPDVALVTNVLPAHVEGFGSLAAIRQEKLRIFDGLSLGLNNGLGAEGTAVINLDDAYASDALKHTGRKIAFSLNPPTTTAEHAGYKLSYAAQAQPKASGAWAFDWWIDGTHTHIELAVLGKHNLANALGAATMAHAAGIPTAAIQAGLAAFCGEKGRMQAKTTPTGALLIDDTYNANPGSVASAIAYLAERPGLRVLVLGDMKELGPNALDEHMAIGQLAASAGIQQLFTLGELSAASSEAFGPGAVHCSSHETLIAALQPLMTQNVVCLVKGSRSMRMERIVEALMVSDS